MKPLVLDSVNKSIVAVMSDAAATTNPDFTAHYGDHGTGSFAESANDGVFNDTFEVTLVPAPSGSTRRVINEITISNVDTDPVTIEIFYKNDTDTRRIWYGTIVVNGTFTLNGLYDENGALQTAIATIPAHGHTDSTNGGTLNAAAIASGTLAAARGGLGADASAFSGLIKMAAGAASVATAETDYVTPTGTGTLTGKTIDGDDNTLQDVPLSAIKTVGANTKRLISRDASGVISDATSPAFDNAQHNHQNAAGGGSLDGAAIGSGTVAAARLGTMTGDSGSGGAKGAVPAPSTGDASKFLRGDASFAQVDLSGSNVTGALAAARFPALTGDITTPGASLATTLKNTGPGAGSFAYPTTFTIDAQGRITAATAGSAPGSVVLVANTFLGAAAANIDLTSISGAYSHLKLILNLRSDVSANTDSVYIRFNNDSAAGNYYSYTTVTFGTGTPTITPTQRLGATATGIEAAAIVGDTATSGYFATLTVDIYNYAHTGRIREVDFRGGYQIGTSTGNLRNVQGNGTWTNTADAINRITLVPAAGSNWKADSSYQLIGIP